MRDAREILLNYSQLKKEKLPSLMYKIRYYLGMLQSLSLIWLCCVQPLISIGKDIQPQKIFFLLIEVSDTTIKHDREKKIPLYANTFANVKNLLFRE